MPIFLLWDYIELCYLGVAAFLIEVRTLLDLVATLVAGYFKFFFVEVGWALIV